MNIETDYQIVLIIIMIIGFIISTAFYVYFVYLPASRIEDQFEIINTRSNEVLDVVNQRIILAGDETVETLISVCGSIQSFICAYNCSPIGGNCLVVGDPFCPLRIEAYPVYCQDLLSFDSCPAPLSSNCTPTQCH